MRDHLARAAAVRARYGVGRDSVTPVARRLVSPARIVISRAFPASAVRLGLLVSVTAPVRREVVAVSIPSPMSMRVTEPRRRAAERAATAATEPSRRGTAPRSARRGTVARAERTDPTGGTGLSLAVRTARPAAGTADAATGRTEPPATALALTVRREEQPTSAVPRIVVRAAGAAPAAPAAAPTGDAASLGWPPRPSDRSSSSSLTAAAPVDVTALADQVITAIDRRLVASVERLGRG